MVLDADRAFPALRERINTAGIGRTIVVSGRGNRKAARVIDADGTQGAEGLGRNAVSAAVKIAVAVKDSNGYTLIWSDVGRTQFR